MGLPRSFQGLDEQTSAQRSHVQSLGDPLHHPASTLVGPGYALQSRPLFTMRHNKPLGGKRPGPVRVRLPVRNFLSEVRGDQHVTSMRGRATYFLDARHDQTST